MKWFKNLKLQNKFFLVFGIFILMMVLLTLFTFWEIFHVGKRYDQMVTSYVARQRNISYAMLAVHNVRYSNLFRQHIIEKENIEDVDFEPAYAEGLANYLAQFRSLMRTDTVSLDYEERQKRNKIVDEIEDLYLNRYKPSVVELNKAFYTNDEDRISKAVFETRAVGDTLSMKMQSLLDLAFATGEIKMSEALDYSLRVTFVFGIASTCICVISLILAAFLSRVVKNPIKDMEHAMIKISRGNLDYPIRSEYTDELGLLSNHIGDMVEKIAEMNKSMTIMDHIGVKIYVADLNYNLIHINDKMARIYGIDNEAKNGKSGKKCFELLRGYSKPCSNCLMPKIMFMPENDLYSDEEFSWEEKTGKWLNIKATMIRWVDRTQVQFYCLVDETFKKIHLDKQKEYEEQLHEALEMAHEASISKSAFLANMSHEIRTPMNSIMGFSELAMDEDVPASAVKDYISKIRENSEWLLQIINNILDISKIEAGKIELENIPFNLSEIFTHCRAAIMPQIADKGLVLHCYAEPSVRKKLLGDPTRLRQIFINLLSNAVKFTHVGVIKLLSSIKSKTDNTHTIHFEVKDSGIGMSAEQIRKVFDPFIQADTSTTREYGGTGLGLAIVKNIIELMGGKLLVESVQGVGSKFSFEITFKTIDDFSELQDEDFVINKIERPSFEGTVLVFEDNLLNQRLICEHLERVGLKSVIVGNGKEGTDLLKDRLLKNERPFDLIFMDMHMPIMDGLEATSLIVKMNIKTPIVALTANVMVSDREIYKSNGIGDLLGKPFTSQELWRCLLKYIKPIDKLTASLAVETPKQVEVKPKSVYDTPFFDDDFDEKIRRRLQPAFYSEIKTIYREITDALENGDISHANRLAHSLKGNARLFQKSGLFTAAAEVEFNLEDGKNSLTTTHLNILETELNLILKELEKRFG